MTSDPFARSRLRKVLVVVILATIPCYCAGLVAILLAPETINRASGTPTFTSTWTPVVFASLTPSTTFTPLPFVTQTPSLSPTATTTGTTTLTPTTTQTPTNTTSPTPSNTPFIPPTLTNTPFYTTTYTPTPVPTSTYTLTPTSPDTPSNTLTPTLTNISSLTSLPASQPLSIWPVRTIEPSLFSLLSTTPSPQQ
jgi:hypothetical protein